MEHLSLSPQTLAAQALGETDPATGAVAPPITLSTNYEQRPDGSYPQGRVYTRADNPTSEHGADLVVHSASKYLNGHGDVLAGAVLSARRDPLWERIRSWRRNAGAMPGPFEAWLLQRGMRTLFLRVRQASDTAMAIATHFAGHPALSAVLYPGLPGHPGHAIAARQMDGGFGGMLSIRLAGGAEHALAVPGEVRVFKRA